MRRLTVKVGKGGVKVGAAKTALAATGMAVDEESAGADGGYYRRLAEGITTAPFRPNPTARAPRPRLWLQTDGGVDLTTRVVTNQQVSPAARSGLYGGVAVADPSRMSRMIDIGGRVMTSGLGELMSFRTVNGGNRSYRRPGSPNLYGSPMCQPSAGTPGATPRSHRARQVFKLLSHSTGSQMGAGGAGPPLGPPKSCPRPGILPRPGAFLA